MTPLAVVEIILDLSLCAQQGSALSLQTLVKIFQGKTESTPTE